MSTEKPAPAASLMEALIDVAVSQETAVLTALQTGLVMAAHPAAKPRSDEEVEADQDNLPV